VSDGRATLSGHITDSRTHERAEQLAREVTGVDAVTDALISDAQLIDDVARAFSQIALADRESAGFTVRHGIVTLFGTVRDARVREDLESVVSEVPELRMLINQLQIPGTPELAVPAQLLQPRRSQNVFGHDGYIGQVERVVIDPRLRQVTQIVIRADEPAHESMRGGLVVPSGRRRLLVVPAHLITTLSRVEVFLNADRRTIWMAPDYQARHFAAPAAGWRAPFPYEHDEVVVEARHRATVAERQPNPADAYLLEGPYQISAGAEQGYARPTPAFAMTSE
jgi:hypothetical protein